MKLNPTQTNLKILEWVLFIGLSIVSGWFAKGVLQQFFSRKTSFAQYEDTVTDYPVISLGLFGKASGLDLSNVKIKYGISRIITGNPILQIGVNHLHNEKYNITEKVILQRIEDKYRRIGFNLGFRLIHETPRLVKKRARVTIPQVSFIGIGRMASLWKLR